MTPKRIELVIIDPQNDFCDPKGSLFVAGANEDMTRLAEFIKVRGMLLSDINVTLDSHHPVDVAHPCFWVDQNGKNPDPFTIISAADVANGIWIPSVPSKSIRDRMKDYVEQLEKGNRYPLCIWPPHCLIGSWGNNIYPELFEVLTAWEIKNFSTMSTVPKGSNPFTEHYSAIKAEVTDPKDNTTQLNVAFINKLKECDEILIAGEALSHCVKSTFEDVISEFGSEEFAKKLVLLSDVSSSVTGFEKEGQDFIDNLRNRGAIITTTKEFSF
jgi:nicotinamidase/pyrazinamidase